MPEEKFIPEEAKRKDLSGILALYTQLHDNPIPKELKKVKKLWRNMRAREGYHLIVLKTREGQIVASCVCVIVPNLTHGQRPYALVENVVTHEAFRKRGYASRCLEYAKKLAKRENCYKIMLLTGSKRESTLRFYENAGYNRKDKTGFVQWLEP